MVFDDYNEENLSVIDGLSRKGNKMQLIEQQHGDTDCGYNQGSLRNAVPGGELI